jgi:hypothetical protein
VTPDALSWIWLLFNGQHPDRQSLESLLDQYQPSARVYMAERDEHSHRANQWTRDPLEQLPSGRVAVIAKETLDTSFINAMNALTGTTAYQSQVRTPKALPLARQQRYEGTLQLCCFRRLAGLSDDDLATAWLDRHTAVALETQSTEGYRQHWVNSHPALGFDGIVEEYFPESAADSVAHFFNAVGDREKLKQHINRMTASTGQFIDLDQSEVIHLTDTRLR